jgi:hypothetical protein
MPKPDSRYTAGDLAMMNRTARSGGAVGRLPVVPAFVASLALARGRRRVLDYGSGPKARQAAWLRRAHRSWKVTAWDIGANFDPEVHDRRALRRKYDVVMASNVLNVQPTNVALGETIHELYGLVRQGGALVVNYPSSPRRIPDLDIAGITGLLAARFGKVTHYRKGVMVARK